jgi:hypothetical protein
MIETGREKSRTPRLLPILIDTKRLISFPHGPSEAMSEIEKAASTPDANKTGSQVEHLDPKMIDTGAVGQNPLARLTDEQIIMLAEEFVQQHGLGEYKESILKGALVAKDPLSEPVSQRWYSTV